ncbi:hypothetical protein CFC21_105299 [Triticum aestivum]|uniref:Isopenicillin N synthase-like Fe(2+) 2OG dioxygenase domain-containing protein n=2 Tax=Triticum aestivum TaxID=4565 RepID=A0A9R1N8A7_WHEAT|nr:S-norcoclaurine synthase 1-like [Triticum aestivum]KAF7104399.1 hypothetical protein CFC21_105299 [Triticum aestivum]
MAYNQQFKILEVPPIVQELVAGGLQEPPGQYVVPEQDRPAATVSEMPEPIPIVDLSRMSSNSAEEFTKLQSALENWDLFLILSNGFFKSPVHRVVTNVEKERLSLVMFYTLDPETEIEPVSELVDEKRPTQYMKMKNKDYIAKFYKTYATGKLAIDNMKI